MTATLGFIEAKDTTSTRQVPDVPETNAKIYTLSNGLTIIVEEDPGSPVASIQAWCGTGSVHEGKWLGAGLSHILEHMLFKGTESRKAGDIARQIQDRGGYINAYTSFDRTVYWIDVPNEGAAEAVEIIADAMMNSTLPPEEYEKEQEVIRREFAMGFDDPGRMSSQLMLQTVFKESPFRHPVIGYLDVYNKLTRDDVLEYYKKRYVPNNLTFVVVGNVKGEEIRDQLERFFEKYPRKPLEPLMVATEREQMGRREAHEEFPTELTRLSLAWRIPGLTDPNTPALELLSLVLGSGRSSILNREIREKKRLVHSIFSGMYTLQTDGVFVIQAVCDPDKREEVEKEILAVLQQVKSKGVSAAELQKARASMLSSQIGTLTTARGRASDLGSNWLLTGNLNFSRDYLDAIAAVKPVDLQNVANQYLSLSKINVTSLNPIGSIAQKEESKALAEASEVQKFTLPNGLRLLVREDSRLPMVTAVAVFRGGLLAENKEQNGITKLLARSILKGTKTRSAEQIAEQIESVGGTIGSDAGNNSFNVSVEVLKPDLSMGLDLLADVVMNPSFPEDEVELEKQTQIAGIKAEEEQVTMVARNLLRERLFGNHPYSLRSSGTAESVAGLAPAALQAFHNKLVCGENGVIAVFGDVKAEEVLALMEKLFGKLPQGELALQDAPQPEPLEGRVYAVEKKDKQQAVLMVGFLGVDALNPDRPALELIEEASSDLGSRFFNRIREQMGLAYFVGASQMIGLTPGVMVFYLGTDPKKVDPVRVAFNEEIQKLATEGLTPEELERAKKKRLGAEAIQNQSNSSFALACAIDEITGLGYDRYKKRTEELQSVTLEDAKRVAQKYLTTGACVEALVKPPDAPTPEATPSPES